MKVLYFAWLRERIGESQETLSPPAEVHTAHDLALWLAGRSEAHASAFADLSHVRTAIDRQLAPLDTPLNQASEVAFFPPMTGG